MALISYSYTLDQIWKKSIPNIANTHIFLSGGDAKEISNTLSTELYKLNSWFAVNKLSLNVSKTNYMIFGNKKIDNDMNIRVGINGISIDRVYNSKILGVTIDEKLNWKEHIKMIQSQISKQLQ